MKIEKIDLSKAELSEMLIKIVNEVFKVDMIVKSSKRQVTDARAIYSKILRDNGYTFEFIGDSIKKNHATILHYTKNINFILHREDELMKKYKECCESIVFSTTEGYVSKPNKLLNSFVDYIENYEKENNRMPTITEYRETISPLFYN